MAAGRPRTLDREKLQDNLIEWVQKDSSLNLCGFCHEYFMDPDYILKLSKSDEEFGRTYRYVKAVLGSRRELKLKEGELHTKAYDLNASTYDAFLKEEKKEMLKYENEIKSESGITIAPEEMQKFDALMNKFKSRQSSSNIDDTNSIKE